MVSHSCHLLHFMVMSIRGLQVCCYRTMIATNLYVPIQLCYTIQPGVTFPHLLDTEFLQ